MTDNELLLALSNVMDRKLDTKMTALSDTMDRKLDAKMAALSDTMDRKLDAKMAALFDAMDRKLDEKLDMKLNPVKADLTGIKMTLENNILPRLQNIESCYVSTYERYRDCADQMQAACDDVALLKKVVAEHSEKLKKIS